MVELATQYGRYGYRRVRRNLALQRPVEWARELSTSPVTVEELGRQQARGA
jgi:hypothetical protein